MQSAEIKPVESRIEQEMPPVHYDVVPASPSSLVAHLSEFKGAMNQHFHFLGEELQWISNEARSISELSQRATSLLTRADSNSVMQMLRGILSDVRRIQVLIGSSRQMMREIQEHLDRSRPLLDRLQQRSSVLRTMSVLSHIEQARLANAHVDHFSVASDINNLANEIELHELMIAREQEYLRPLVLAGVQKLSATEEGGRQSTSGVICQTEAVLDELEERLDLSKAAALNIDRQFGEIRKSIAAIVMSLQTEDMARQRLEHIEEALLHIANNSPDEQRKAGILQLQRSQLVSTWDLISGSVDSVSENLRMVQAGVGDLTGQAETLRSKTGLDGRSSTAGISDRLNELSFIIQRYSALVQTANSTVQTVSTSVSRMVSGATDLKRTESSIRITVLNARIETGRLGHDGAAMRILSSQVQEVAQESTHDTQAVLEQLHQIEAALASAPVDDLESVVAILTSFASENTRKMIEGLSRSIAKGSYEASRVLGSLAERSRGFCERIENVTQMLEKDKGLSELFDKMMRQLDLVFSEKRGTSGTLAHGGLDKSMADLTLRYSMRAERDVYHQFLDSTRSVPPGNLTVGEPSPPVGISDDSIELF